MRIWPVVALCAGLFATSAAAQSDGAAEQLLRSWGATDLFSPQADTPQVVIRHNASRLICRFDHAEGASVRIYDSGLPRGDDVSCGQNTGVDTVTLYATRYPHEVTTDTAIAQSVTEITAVSPQARAIPSPP